MSAGDYERAARGIAPEDDRPLGQTLSEFASVAPLVHGAETLPVWLKGQHIPPSRPPVMIGAMNSEENPGLVQFEKFVGLAVASDRPVVHRMQPSIGPISENSGYTTTTT